MPDDDHHQPPKDEAPSDRLFGFIALSGLALSLLAHFAAVCGVDVSARLPFVWVLHAGVFVVFIPFVLSARRTLGPKLDLVRLREILPAWLFTAGAVLFAYVIINFFVSTSLLEGGSPGVRDGKFVLQNKGHLIREITESEYHQHRAYELRTFSGHWLVFYFVPFAYFLFRKRARPAGSDSPSIDGDHRA